MISSKMQLAKLLKAGDVIQLVWDGYEPVPKSLNHTEATVVKVRDTRVLVKPTAWAEEIAIRVQHVHKVVTTVDGRPIPT